MSDNKAEWDECLRIVNLPQVNELFQAFAQGETTEDTAAMIVREILRAANKAKEDVLSEAQKLVGQVRLWEDTTLTVSAVEVKARCGLYERDLYIFKVLCRYTQLSTLKERHDWFNWPFFKDLPEAP